MFSPSILDGENILITGGAGGLGQAMARGFLDHGAQVILCGRSVESLTKAQHALQTGAEDRVHIVQLDVREPQQVELAFEQALRLVPNITGLVNNAAGNFYAASEDLSANGFKSVVETVLYGTFYCTQQFAKHCIAHSRPGTVLNIVTTYAESGSAFVLPSACAKAGVQALTTSLAYEWAEYNIRLNAIAPGPFPTPGAWARLIPGSDFETLYRERLPSKRFGVPTEFASLATFLMSNLSSYINGACIPIDGGERLQGGQFNFLTSLMPRDALKQVFATMRKNNKTS